MEFNDWLLNIKHFTPRTAKDIQSRKKRVLEFTNEKEVTAKTLDKLASCPQFLTLSVSVKSQLRRSIKLYMEFTDIA